MSTPEPTQRERLRLSEKVGYGLGDTASNLYFQFFNLFLFYYYTDVFGLNPASVGTMYLVANFWDAVNDPMMGAIADRVRTARGRYRPFLLWFAVLYGVFGYLCRQPGPRRDRQVRCSPTAPSSPSRWSTPPSTFPTRR